MKTELKVALDYVKRIKPSFLFIDQNEDSTVVRAIDDSKSVFINLNFPKWDNLNSSIIVSNIPYLTKILSMADMVTNGTIEFENGYNGNGEEIIRNLVFLTNKTRIKYSLTDPRIETTTRAPKAVKNIVYTAEYTLTEQDIANLKEAIQLHETVIDRADNGFIIPYVLDGKLAFEFPYQISTINLTMENQVEGDISFKSAFPLSMFSMVLQTLMSKPFVNIRIAESLIQFETGDDMCIANVYLPKSTRRIGSNG